MLDNSQKPTDVELYQLKEANALIEEYMLMANVAVADFILSKFPRFALLRRHPVPGPNNFERLVRMAKSAGHDLKTENSKILAQSLDSITSPRLAHLLRILTTRCMFQAVYFSSGELEQDLYYHYGLASPVYTHFTSPIRRYADLIVHRLLAAAISIETLPNEIADAEHMRTVAETLNHRTRMAQMASRASVEYFKVSFFESKGAVECDAIVIKLSGSSIDVFVPEYGIEASVHLKRQTTDPDEEGSSTTDEFEMNVEGHLVKIFADVRVALQVQVLPGNRKYLEVKIVKWPDELSGKRSGESLASSSKKQKLNN